MDQVHQQVNNIFKSLLNLRIKNTCSINLNLFFQEVESQKGSIIHIIHVPQYL